MRTWVDYPLASDDRTERGSAPGYGLGWQADRGSIDDAHEIGTLFTRKP